MMYYVSQNHAVQHVGELLQVKISCKLYFRELDSPLNEYSGWRLRCQSVCLQHRQLWQHNLQGSRNTHKADFCQRTLSGDSCQSWKSACKPASGFCILLCRAIFMAQGLKTVARMKFERRSSGRLTSALRGSGCVNPGAVT